MIACEQGFNPTYHEQSPATEQIAGMSGYVVLEFGNAWCGHCMAATPAVKQVLASRNLMHIKIADGKGKRLGRFFKVKLWPTLILLHSGNEVARLVRPTTVVEVENFLAQIMQ